MANDPFWDETNTAVYLAVLSETGLILRSAKKVGCSPDTVEDRKKVDSQFRKACENAQDEYNELLVDELDRRARRGVPKTVYFKGKEVGKELQFSDRLLELQLKARVAGFRERGIGIEVAQGGVLVVGVPALDNKKWREAQNEKPTELEGGNCKQIGHEGDDST